MYRELSINYRCTHREAWRSPNAIVVNQPPGLITDVKYDASAYSVMEGFSRPDVPGFEMIIISLVALSRVRRIIYYKPFVVRHRYRPFNVIVSRPFVWALLRQRCEKTVHYCDNAVVLWLATS